VLRQTQFPDFFIFVSLYYTVASINTIFKAVPVGVAWLIIFMHGVIPHNHHQEHASGCVEIYHCCHEGDHETENTGNTAETVTGSADSEEKHFICHFNTAPFHPLDNDTPFFHKDNRSSQPERSEPQIHSTYYSQPFISSHLFRPDNLRAPPARMGMV
jgi:hypothetical protein